MLPIDEDKLVRDVEYLNAFNVDGVDGWREVTARKDHIDNFGGKINAGELYYMRNVPGQFAEYFRLSKRSMSAFLEVLFFGTPPLLGMAEELVKRKKAREEEAVRELKSRASRLRSKAKPRT